MAQPKIKSINLHHGGIRVFGNSYAPQQLTFTILDGLYQRTILKKIVQKYIANIVPSFYTLTVEDADGRRLKDIEKECKELSMILNRTLYKQILKSFFLYGTAITFNGNRGENNLPEEIICLHPRDVKPKLYEHGSKMGEIEYWSYMYNGKEVQIAPEYIKVFANDPDIGGLFGYSIVNHLQDTLHQFLNNRLDLAEILNRYAIPIVQWAVDVSEVAEESQNGLITKAKIMLEEQLAAGDDFVSDARIEPRTLSFANDVGHLIAILQESRRDLGMLSIPESLLGGQISNLSGGKTQAAVFMQEIAGYRADFNDFLAEEYFIPFLETKGKIRGKDYHNVYIAFPPSTTELPSEAIAWVKNAVELGAISLSEGRAVLGFRGAAPGVTPELEEIYKVRSIQWETQQPDDKTKKDTNVADPTKSGGKTKIDDPGKRNGIDPDRRK